VKVVEVKKLYPVARAFTSIFSLLGWLAVIAAVIIASLNMRSTGFEDCYVVYSKLYPALIAIVVGFMFLFLGEMIKIIIDIEENVRTTAMITWSVNRKVVRVEKESDYNWGLYDSDDEKESDPAWGDKKEDI